MVYQRNPQKIQFTKEGYEKIQKDFSHLTEKRKEAVINLRTAREMGDLSENGAYKAARWELGGIDRQLRRLSYLLRMAKVYETNNNGFIDFGRKVTLFDGKSKLTFILVSSFESDPTQDKLSIESPIGKAIIGKRVGDMVRVTTPSGIITYTIDSIE